MDLITTEQVTFAKLLYRKGKVMKFLTIAITLVLFSTSAFSKVIPTYRLTPEEKALQKRV